MATTKGTTAPLLYLTLSDHGRRLTLDELERAAGQEGYHCELIEGRLCVSPLPNLPHDCLRHWIFRILRGYVQDHIEIINQVLTPARVIVPDRQDETAPEPDVAACNGFPPDQPIASRRWQDVSPVIVVELLSEDNADKDLVRNLDHYLAAPSIREYWITDPRNDPDRPSMTIYRRRGRQWQRPIEVPARGTYTTRLLPEFGLVLDPHL